MTSYEQRRREQLYVMLFGGQYQQQGKLLLPKPAEPRYGPSPLKEAFTAIGQGGAIGKYADQMCGGSYAQAAIAAEAFNASYAAAQSQRYQALEPSAN